ncbi:hypothetical protein [Streptomyces sp. SudanB25_2051]|uniref:hypothetical protein n=1 Tax=Streptomyces sp. SudanB25_2051 TaxID=3035275 RepID=UPI003F54A058
MADESAPRLCLVTGSRGCGKSTLLAWLVAHGTRPGTPAQRRVHAFVPLGCLGLRAAAWTLADQLQLSAPSPADLLQALALDPRPTTIVLPDLHTSAAPDALTELVAALLGLDHIRLIAEIDSQSPATDVLASHRPAVMNLDHDQWTDADRLVAWRRQHRPSFAPLPEPTWIRSTLQDLDDPAHVTAADPLQVTTHYEASHHDHGGLRTAWLRAGQSLISEHQPSLRALLLLAALGDSADPRLRHELTALAADASWQLLWSRVSGDIRPPWPGPARALAFGPAPDTTLLVADHQGVVRILSVIDAHPAGRLSRPFHPTNTLVSLPDATVLALTGQGQLDAQRLTVPSQSTGISALLTDHASTSELLIDTLREHLARHPGRVVAASTSLLAVADRTGAVYAFPSHSPTDGPRTATLHQAPVTAMAVVDLHASESFDDTEPVPLLFSGALDGKVHAWAPGKEAIPTPIAARPAPVTALAAAHTPTGPSLAIAWADGLIEHHHLNSGTLRTFRPGPPVQALALTPQGHMVVGAEEMLICLSPR